MSSDLFVTLGLALQIGLAQFLEFCLKASEANGGAVPVLVAHNSNFDNGMLLGDCWQSGLHVPPQWRSLCTFRMAKRLAQACPQLAALPTLSLGPLARHFGCAPVPALPACMHAAAGWSVTLVRGGVQVYSRHGRSA